MYFGATKIFAIALVAISLVVTNVWADDALQGLPDLRGETVEDAQAILRDHTGEGVEIIVQEIESLKAIGSIVTHWPGPGGTVGEGGLLAQVSIGYQIPQGILDGGLEAAKARLEEAGVVVRVRRREVSNADNMFLGEIVPAAGTWIDASTSFVVLVDPPPAILVPNSMRRADYEAVGLIVDWSDNRRPPPRQPMNLSGRPSCYYYYYSTVLDITPSPGTPVLVGSTVRVVLSSGPLRSEFSQMPGCVEP